MHMKQSIPILREDITFGVCFGIRCSFASGNSRPYSLNYGQSGGETKAIIYQGVYSGHAESYNN